MDIRSIPNIEPVVQDNDVTGAVLREVVNHCKLSKLEKFEIPGNLFIGGSVADPYYENVAPDLTDIKKIICIQTISEHIKYKACSKCCKIRLRIFYCEYGSETLIGEVMLLNPDTKFLSRSDISLKLQNGRSSITEPSLFLAIGNGSVNPPDWDPNFSSWVGS